MLFDGDRKFLCNTSFLFHTKVIYKKITLRDNFE